MGRVSVVIGESAPDPGIGLGRGHGDAAGAGRRAVVAAGSKDPCDR